uniref:Domain X domain-containing protein n=1 Tax=Pyropia kanakaensis TaxID=139729 RepID=A0A060D3Q7_9RHOD|nr:hypothetical protein GU34_p12 [Pyropia kanakaensis]AIB08209.1 hypothetical protein [Pyropia kanakaensis]
MNKFCKTIFSRLGLSDPKWFYYCSRLMENTLNVMWYLNLLSSTWRLLGGPARFTKVKKINFNVDNSQPKRNNNFNFGNTGSPKCWQAYGDRVDVVRKSKIFGRSTVKLFSTKKFYSTGCTTNVEQKFKSFVKRAVEFPKETIDRNLYHFLCDTNFLKIAYNNIRHKFDNITLEITTEILDAILKDIANSLLTESFCFKSYQKTHIANSSGSKNSSIAVFIRDKIVQEAMRIILDAAFEPTFLESSYNYRPQKSCHSTLKTIKCEFKSVVWVISKKSTKCSTIINCTLLMQVIEAKILDRQFTKLISKSLKASYFNVNTTSHNIVEISQKSAIYFTLCNIFMHQLDVFIKNLFDQKVKIKNLKYKTKLNKQHKLPLRSPVMNLNESFYKRFKYIRYADDWIIGTKGSFVEIAEILKKVKIFLATVMHFNKNDSKIKITNFNKNEVIFLGINISKCKHGKSLVKNSLLKQRQNLQLHVRIDQIRSKLSNISILSGNLPVPKFLWLPLDHDQIIYLYNLVMVSFLNFYSFVDNYSQFSSWFKWVIYSSAAKLLARKFSSSVTKIFTKFGTNLSSGKSALYDPKHIASKFKHTSDYGVKMYYIKEIVNFNSKISDVNRLTISSNKKQFSLCRKCHTKYQHSKI